MASALQSPSSRKLPFPNQKCLLSPLSFLPFLSSPFLLSLPLSPFSSPLLSSLGSSLFLSEDPSKTLSFEGGELVAGTFIRLVEHFTLYAARSHNQHAFVDTFGCNSLLPPCRCLHSFSLILLLVLSSPSSCVTYLTHSIIFLMCSLGVPQNPLPPSPCPIRSPSHHG